MKQLLIPLAIVWTCCTAASTPTPAIQEDSTRVAYADLDLSSAQGQAKLQRRIDFAVRRVCRDPASRSLEAAEEQRACEERARRGAAIDVSRLALASASGLGGPTREQSVAPDQAPGWR